MLFNSIHFFIFLPIVFLLYWMGASKKLWIQNSLLLLSSYYFYSCWDYRFLFLLIFSTLLDYFSALKIAQTGRPKTKKIWLLLSICINLGFLGIFKYYNFFMSSFSDFLSLLGLSTNLTMLNIVLPVGISFYTFHGISYILDVYNTKIVPTKNFIDYSVFVSFFPLLIAGPIERATHLLPQIEIKRTFCYAKAIDGLRQILWGFFKKIVIADNCADFANIAFDHSSTQTGYYLLMGAFFFSIQIYCDFSGYSDIALGTARLFGIELLRNFAFPYFSRDIAEFWRRWHISLTSWFKDYLYIPMGGSKGNTLFKVRNTFIIFIVSGFWHGANWTFIAWGVLNAIYFLPLLLRNRNRKNMKNVAEGRHFPNLSVTLQIFTTFTLITFAWIFFRSNSLNDAFDYILKIFIGIAKNPGKILLLSFWQPYSFLLFLILLFLLLEWHGREEQFAFATTALKWPWSLRWLLYYALLFIIFYFAGKDQQFIYFQF